VTDALRLDPSAASALLDTSKSAFATMLGDLPNVSYYGEGGLWWVDTGLPDATFNVVYQAPDSGDDDEYALAAATAVDHFRRRDLPFHWDVGLRPEPAEAGRILTLNGLRHVEDEPGMWLDLGTDPVAVPQVEGLTVEPVTDPATLREWIEVWGGPAPASVRDLWYEVYRWLPVDPEGDLRMLLGRLDGEPAATVQVVRTASVAAVNWVVTPERLRRRGIGTAITSAALAEARRAGCRIAVLTASPFGERIYRGLGFRQCCTVGTYEWEPGLTTAR